MDPQSTLSCSNCQAVTTNDGKTVWVCENCGLENEPVTPDAAAAQAAIAAAASAAGTPLTSTPQPSAPIIPSSPPTPEPNPPSSTNS